ncbi:hypothetical protein [Rhizobium leguminosarum]|uniref:hypothetical protein n=1 Tax=Rhizobium leguminosarum TaxID=384 RepID=UPI002E146DBE|nr:hypothetical protein U8Q02_38115 [Rhizobium leguminosarum]
MTDHAASHTLDDLATELSQGLSEGFEFVAVDAGGYVAIVSARYGVAAVVPESDPKTALSAAEKLSSVAKAAGLDLKVVPVGISADDTKASSAFPVLVRPRYLSTDILSAMVSGGSAIGDGAAAALLHAVKAIPRPRVIRPISENLLLCAEAVVRRAIPDGSAWAFGVQIDAKDVVAPEFLLPAILVCAAKRWAPPVVAAGKQGGFVVRIAPNPTAVLGYEVVGLEVSSPVLFFLPIVDVVRKSRLNGECWLDGVIDEFAAFLADRGEDGALLSDLEVRVAVGV